MNTKDKIRQAENDDGKEKIKEEKAVNKSNIVSKQHNPGAASWVGRQKKTPTKEWSRKADKLANEEDSD